MSFQGKRALVVNSTARTVPVVKNDDFVLGDHLGSVEDRAQAIATLLSTGDTRALTEETARAALTAASTARGWLNFRRGGAGQIRSATEEVSAVLNSARSALINKNHVLDAAMKQATAQQRFELQRAQLATEIAKEERKRAEHEEETRLLREGCANQTKALAAAKLLNILQCEVRQSKETTAALRKQLAEEQQRSRKLVEELQAAHARNLDEKACTERQRSAEIAAEKHRTAVAKEKLRQAFTESRIQGLADPDEARARRVRRHAEREGRKPAEAAQLVSELAEQAERAIKSAEEKYGADSQIVEMIRNHWDAKLSELGPMGAEQ